MKIWQRYLFRQSATVFFFILFAMFSIYLFIDLSIHGVRFAKGTYTPADLVLYYIRNFSIHLNLFIPFAFLLTLLKVLFDLSAHLEILSLEMGRLSKKKILLPFFVLSALLTLLGYANEEWVLPQAIADSHAFRFAHGSKKKKFQPKQVQTLTLEDNSTLIYHYFDPIKQELSDVFWFSIPQHIFHIKTLSLKTDPPTAYFSDHFIDQNGKLTKSESALSTSFEILSKSILHPATQFTPIESHPISVLLKETAKISPEQPKIQTHLHNKLATPLLPFLILIVAAPFALIHSRTRPTFLIVSLSLLGLIVVMTLFNGLLILGENNIIAPWIAIWTLPCLICAVSFRKFQKL